MGTVVGCDDKGSSLGESSDDVIGLDEAGCRDLDRSTALEWVDTNGRGGYASGTVSGVPTRRYHGLLLVASHPPHARIMLVNHLAEWIETSNGRVALSSRAGAAPEEDGYRRALGFASRPVAEWSYELGDAKIIRSIVCPAGRDTVIICWRIEGGDGRSVRLVVEPMLTVRADHAVANAHEPVSTAADEGSDGVSWQPRPDFPRVYARGAEAYAHAPSWRRAIEYAVDRERGEPHREDWWCPGKLSFELAPDHAVYLTLTIERDGDLDGATAFGAEVERRRARRAVVRSTSSHLYDRLLEGAEFYAIEVGDRAAVLAGIPWFDVWTRDTFTAFAGLFLVTRRFELAARVLKTFAARVDGGLLPNNLPDEVTAPRWASVDASLWFIVAVGRYAAAAADLSVLASVWPAVKALIDGYMRGTGHVSIGVAADGLILASDASDPLTWMDAKCDGHVMTPRRGKPVEVQALWIQALAVASDLARRFGDSLGADALDGARARAIASFRARFWCEAGGYLFDVIDGPDGDDATFRPNQVFSLSFDAELVPAARAHRILELMRRRLLTPRGLRTLSEDDPSFYAHYAGPRPSRDAAYHQGTVWPFLLGPFVVAWIRYFGDAKDVRAEARSFLRGIEDHLATEGCLGHLSEIFDGAAPHAPRGCFAQAWSLGEILVALKVLES